VSTAIEGIGCGIGISLLKAAFMDKSFSFAKLGHVSASYILLGTMLAVGMMYQTGMIGWVDPGLYLVADPKSSVRLIAASSLLSEESLETTPGDVLVDALGDSALRVRAAPTGPVRVPRQRGYSDS
jgi:hypothetical protein